MAATLNTTFADSYVEDRTPFFRHECRSRLNENVKDWWDWKSRRQTRAGEIKEETTFSTYIVTPS